MTDVIAVAIIAHVAPVLTVLVTWNQQRKTVNKIHGAVNGNLETALKRIDELERQVAAHHEGNPS